MSNPGLRLQLKSASLWEAFLFLGLALVSIHGLSLEPEFHLEKLFAVVMGALVFQGMVPNRMRQSVQLIAALVLLFWVVGVVSGLVVIGMGLLLFAALHVPLPSIGKMIFAGVVGVGLPIGLRLLSVPELSRAVPLIGGMFMFRAMLYLYEAKVGKLSGSFVNRLGYFFLLPNVVFQIFPIVDWRLYSQNWTESPSNSLRRRGARWIANGLLHLMVYRLVYHLIIPDVQGLIGPKDWLVFVASNYILIVRLVGMFHISAGILCLLGWDLPKTFDHYFFAKDFNDLWARINRYWRDFVMRVFYYPIYFQFKRLGNIRAMVISLGLVFIINWFLHGWQYFWLRGEFPIKEQDVVFWGTFGLVVAVNAVHSARSQRRVPLASMQALKSAGVFWFIAVLWSFWISPNTKIWFAALAAVKYGDVWDWAMALAMLVGSWGVAWIFFMRKENWIHSKSMVWSWLLLAVLLGLTRPEVQRIKWLEGGAFLWSNQLNEWDQAKVFDGYYSEIIDGESMLSEWAEGRHKRKKTTFNPIEGGAFQCYTSSSEAGAADGLSLNRFGYRGVDWVLIPDSGVIRALLPGGSIESGIGVEVDSILSSVAERRVNGALQEGSGGASRFEFINASVGANYLIDRWYHWMRVDSVLEYDFIVFPLHSRDLFRTMRDTREHYETSPTLQHVVSELGWPTPGEPWGVDEPESAKRLTFAYLDFIRSEAERLGKPIYFQKMLSYDFEELQTESEFFRAVDAWALERGVFVRPPCPKYAASDSHDVRLNALDSHYSAWAHRIVGEDLAAGISTFIQLIYSEKNNTN